MKNDLNDVFKHEALLIVISGPSAAGKDTVVKELKQRNTPFHFVVTATSRAPRTGEVHGVDYFFVSRAEFERMIAAGELIEYAKVYEDWKGVPKAQVKAALASGKDVIMRLDVQGAATIRKQHPETVSIYITATEEEAIQRMKMRDGNLPPDYATRLETMRAEAARIPEFDYVVHNRTGCLEETLKTVLSIIEAEHSRTKQRKINL